MDVQYAEIRGVLPGSNIEDLISLIDRIDACSVILVGAGIGTTISFKAALISPDRIHGLILISVEDIEDDVGKELVKLLK